jgi:hypothetical protein
MKIKGNTLPLLGVSDLSALAFLRLLVASLGLLVAYIKADVTPEYPLICTTPTEKRNPAMNWNKKKNLDLGFDVI